jgi:hypothetical protein
MTIVNVQFQVLNLTHIKLILDWIKVIFYILNIDLILKIKIFTAIFFQIITIILSVFNCCKIAFTITFSFFSLTIFILRYILNNNLFCLLLNSFCASLNFLFCQRIRWYSSLNLSIRWILNVLVRYAFNHKLILIIFLQVLIDCISHYIIDSIPKNDWFIANDIWTF